jgi:hypothetical protein
MSASGERGFETLAISMNSRAVRAQGAVLSTIVVFMIVAAGCGNQQDAPSTSTGRSVDSVKQFAGAPSAPPIDTTSEPAPPLPSPDPSVCGPWSNATYSTTGEEIVSRYGEIRNCGKVPGGWFLATIGKAGQPGVLGLYYCRPSDSTCADGTTDHPFENWHWLRPPGNGGGVKFISLQGSVLTLYVGNYGYVTYDLSSGTFKTGLQQ